MKEEVEIKVKGEYTFYLNGREIKKGQNLIRPYLIDYLFSRLQGNTDNKVMWLDINPEFGDSGNPDLITSYDARLTYISKNINVDSTSSDYTMITTTFKGSDADFSGTINSVAISSSENKAISSYILLTPIDIGPSDKF